MYVHACHVSTVPGEARRVWDTLDLELQVGKYKPPCGWEMNSSPLEEQKCSFFTAELSL